ncbi:MAG TPA: S8 family serine peptidase, partial [Sphingomicrobium sp.]|nr:S8 family serine peptidase [Sphingomicrobium sp.]
MAAAGGDGWYAVDLPTAAAEGNAWDLCHALVSGGLGAGAAAPGFAEPDLRQQWIVGEAGEQALAMTASCEKHDEQDVRFPRDPDPLWFQNDQHGQFAAARKAAGQPARGSRVRVAHLDTGYDPHHSALPPNLNKKLQRNFVEADRPDDATDETEGLLNNLGHGTGTISILAGEVQGGSTIGAAPTIEVVPIRVANRVVLFENSAIAKALDYVHELCRTPATKVHVVTMSMGGLASHAWADAVNALYEAGVFIVTAAGNNFGNLPTRHIVYPARFGRVVAACGVMADHKPYADLGFERMAGNYGPPQKMGTAVSGFTPNTPWARLGCDKIVDLNGAGTSAATPQVAAAAALWIQVNSAALANYSEPWMVVEAARAALFQSARLLPGQDGSRLGRGELRAGGALAVKAAEKLKKQPEDEAAFPLLKILTGLGIQEQITPVQRRMLELEALQLSQSAEVEKVLDDLGRPLDQLTQQELQRIADALAGQPSASRQLRGALRAQDRPVRVASLPVEVSTAVKKLHIKHAVSPTIPEPVTRRLRVFAYDPSLELRLETLSINEATLDVRWEDHLAPGPVGEYLEVIDIDPASRASYAPLDLNHPYVLVQDGLRPAEANPQFHQQMVYAVAMKTIQYFEEALGRVALWSPRRVEESDGTFVRQEYVQRLRIYPHALRAENAFYSPDRVALLLGYFKASDRSSGVVLPGSTVFSAVSHDIIAHETTHALLDGLHRRYKEATNDDVLAFHEAFADIVALFQHFTIPEALRSQIAKTRGDLKRNNLLAKLAVQFGEATGRYGALRDAIGRIERDPEQKTEKWVPTVLTGNEYRNATEAHDRGAVLVAAVFDAFVQIYSMRATELILLATSGNGVLPEGELPTLLSDRLAREASKVARQILNICIRALDYCPPIDISFGEYLRAL